MRFFIAFITTSLIYLFLIWVFITYFSKIETLSKIEDEHIVKIDIINMPLPQKKVKKKARNKAKVIKKIVKKKLKKKKVLKNKILNNKKIVQKKKHIVQKTPKKRVIEVLKVEEPIVRERVVKREIYLPPLIEEKIEVEEEIYTPKVVKEEFVENYIEPPQVEEESVSEVENIPFVEETIVEESIEAEPIFSEPIIKNSQPKASKDDLASFFTTGSSIPPSENILGNNYFPNKKIEKLYGASFHTFTPTQKRFIQDNLDTIHRITQALLNRRGYPEGAGRNREEGTNIVSFNLHPNGDISDLHLKKQIGSRPLDDNTLSLIRSAYKDYPYPKTITPIIFYVTYSIYGY